MNRFLPQVSTVCLSIVMATSAQAGLFSKKPAPKKPTEKYPLAGNTSKQPDKELFDKAMIAMRKGKFDVARLDLQTLLNTYPESEYQMRAKLEVGDSWFREGGTAALTEAEGEYKDFITFFPNQPEAAEAQMRVADIYYMQMEKSDRDPTNAERAEEEYRTMIQQYPDSPLVPRAKQKLREVQEVLADRQFAIGSFYASHNNWSATIARLQTVVDRYPLYSHSDLALIGLGDAYAGEARMVQAVPSNRINPKVKEELIKAYDNRAAECYSRVVTHYATAPHVEDARERLIALNRPIPEPTQAEIAESEAIEQSRPGMTLRNRFLGLVEHGPTVINAARVGDPPLTDPAPIYAPDVTHQNQALYAAAASGKPLPPVGESPTPAATQASVAGSSGAAGADSEGGGTLELQSVPNAPANGASPTIGASIVNPGDTSNASPGGESAPGNTPGAAPGNGQPGNGQPGGAGSGDSRTTTTGTLPAAAGSPSTSGAPNTTTATPNYGINAVRPANTALPPIQKPAEVQAQINDVPAGGNTAAPTATPVNGKKPKAPKYDASAEGSSTHKKKKGLARLNPF